MKEYLYQFVLYLEGNSGTHCYEKIRIVQSKSAIFCLFIMPKFNSGGISLRATVPQLVVINVKQKKRYFSDND